MIEFLSTSPSGLHLPSNPKAERRAEIVRAISIARDIAVEAGVPFEGVVAATIVTLVIDHGLEG